MSHHEELFHRLQNLAELNGLIGKTEDLYLECKIWPDKDDDQQRVLAKALCGFANAEGGVLIIGLEAKGGPSKYDPDIIKRASPVSDAMAVKSRVASLVGELVEPRLSGVKVEAVLENSALKAGFVLVDVPATEGLPCRSRKHPKALFGADQGRNAKWAAGAPANSRHRKSRPRVAKFPSIQFKRDSGLAVDSYGIDGSHGFGLPQLPVDPEWVIFGGGADHVVHPGSVLKITRLEQYARPLPGRTPQSRHFAEITLDVQLAADEFPMTTDSKTIPANET